jgi:low temperature requirement protein LtrA
VMATLRTRMTARDIGQKHRAASPLELLFDLTFVVAISLVAGQFAHASEAGHPLDYHGVFAMIFFAIWWAWMNFTWFASAYDTDDVLYRVLVLVQMGGVLVIASGVPAAFEQQDFTITTIGYLIMRVGLVSLWVRAAIEHHDGRSTAVRYAAGIAVVQALWVARLLVQFDWPWWIFLVLAALDLAVPIWAERTGGTAWHPHHIAERYGLFTIILLGESVFASTSAVQAALAEHGGTATLVGIAVCGLVLLFSLWWLYFSESAGEGLQNHRARSYFWGYGHFGIFASLAAIGAALEVTVATTGDDVRLTEAQVGWLLAVPIAVFLVLLWVLHAPMVTRVVVHPHAIVIAAGLIVLVPLAAPMIGVLGELIAITCLLVVLVAVTLLRRPPVVEA